MTFDNAALDGYKPVNAEYQNRNNLNATIMETINLNFFNCSGEIVKSGAVHFENDKMITNGGKIFKVVDDGKFMIKFQKTQIRCNGGIGRLKEIIKESNRHGGHLNCLLIGGLIDL